MLLEAVQQQDTPAVQKLLAQGVSANVTDVRGCSALMWAVRLANLPICQVLLHYGADVNYRDSGGMNALSVSIVEGGTTWMSMRALEEADYVRLAKWLIEHGATAHKDPQEQPNLLVLSYYWLHDWANFCEYLILHGALLQDRKGQHSILNYAASAGKTRLLSLLLKRKFSQQEKDAVLLMAMGGHTGEGNYRDRPYLEKTVSLPLLLAAGANPNACDGNGYSVLQLAVYARDTKTVRLLLSYGARVNLKHPGDGFTPSDTAEWRQDTEIQAILHEARQAK